LRPDGSLRLLTAPGQPGFSAATVALSGQNAAEDMIAAENQRW
jgi:hypothetical protein